MGILLGGGVPEPVDYVFYLLVLSCYLFKYLCNMFYLTNKFAIS